MLFKGFGSRMVESIVSEVSYPALRVTDHVPSPSLINLSDFLWPILIRKTKNITFVGMSMYACICVVVCKNIPPVHSSYYVTSASLFISCCSSLEKHPVFPSFGPVL